jgi:hypothetical protein
MSINISFAEINNYTINVRGIKAFTATFFSFAPIVNNELLTLLYLKALFKISSV